MWIGRSDASNNFEKNAAVLLDTTFAGTLWLGNALVPTSTGKCKFGNRVLRLVIAIRGLWLLSIRSN